ncbi:MAG: alpha-ribazole phosphatase [Firmicutes bacterium HGW-Firmicutes-12]|jgi:alpha-ribazole phosphatase|nr:MAG: alpha-ribazole phosphatase [Firmicutes bacterium HGW-Firmicutes-12]
MAIRLYLVRHGLTIWNHEFRYQGHTDISLSSEGIAQAKALQQRFQLENFTAIFCSDLQRAQETARIINQPHKLRIQVNQYFKEINFGEWEGLTYDDLKDKYPEQIKVWQKTPHLLRLERGETFVELRDRALIGIREITSKYPEGNILIVTHGGTIASLICGLLEEPLTKMWDYKQKNSAVNILNISDKKVTIELLNDTSHLQSD